MRKSDQKCHYKESNPNLRRLSEREQKVTTYQTSDHSKKVVGCEFHFRILVRHFRDPQTQYS